MVGMRFMGNLDKEFLQRQSGMPQRPWRGENLGLHKKTGPGLPGLM
jgi:hypothetical protein